MKEQDPGNLGSYGVVVVGGRDRALVGKSNRVPVCWAGTLTRFVVGRLFQGESEMRS